MPVEKINEEQLITVSKSLNINLSEIEVANYKELVNGTLQAYDLVDDLDNFFADEYGCEMSIESKEEV